MADHICVFAAGDIEPIGHERLRRATEHTDFAIAADGGLAHAVALGVRVDLVVGDLDSVDMAQLAAAEATGTVVERHPVAKDETDLELALERAAGRHPAELTLVGLLGGRIDHELANLSLVAQRRWFDAGLRIVADDGLKRIHVVHDAVELREPAGTTISVLPWLGTATGVTERGMRWDLTGATLEAGTSQGMSNVAELEVQHITVEHGVLLVIVDRSA